MTEHAAAVGVVQAARYSASSTVPSALAIVNDSSTLQPPGFGRGPGEVVDLVEHEREHERFVAPRVVAARRTRVPGVHLGLEYEQELVVGLRGPQTRHPLRRLPVLHAWVVQSAGHEHRGVCSRDDVVVRRVRS